MNASVDRGAELQKNLVITRRVASRTAGLLHLGSGLATEILEVVERMHGTIARFPLPVGKVDDDRTTGITGIVYRGIRNCFEIVNETVGELARQLDSYAGMDDSPAWTAVRAAVNGVCGDALEARGNPLAQPMRIVRHQGDFKSKTLVLFLHGLCMSEYGWRRGEFEEFETWCRQHWLPAKCGARTAHLRYNSGRHISVNGRELAALLENLVHEEGIENLVLIGHSMGGLLIRSACHYALETGGAMQWPARVSHIAMLGTPHLGAPLERIGNLANGLLKISPYSTPLAHIGDLRSAGIKDLRFTNLVDEDWQDVAHDDPRPGNRAVLPLMGHAEYLFIAATRSELAAGDPWACRDDMLVPVPSALGLAYEAGRQIEHPRLRREIVANLDHLALMGNGEVMALLRDWLAAR